MTWKDWKQMDPEDRRDYLECRWEDFCNLIRYCFRLRLHRADGATGKIWGCSIGGLWITWFDLFEKKYVFEVLFRNRYRTRIYWCIQIPPRKVFSPPPPPVVYERALSIPLKDFDNSGEGV